MTSQIHDKTRQYDKKAGKGSRDGVISELATFYEVNPGHENALREACEGLADACAPRSPWREPPDQPARRAAHHFRRRHASGLVHDLRDRLGSVRRGCGSATGIEAFTSWMQRTKEWPRFQAWRREAGGVETLNTGMGDATKEKSVRVSARGLTEYLQAQQSLAVGYWNALSYVTHAQIRKALEVYEALQRVLDSPGAEALQNPAMRAQPVARAEATEISPLLWGFLAHVGQRLCARGVLRADNGRAQALAQQSCGVYREALIMQEGVV